MADRKNVCQNVIMLREALKTDDLDWKVDVTAFLNDDGIYCGALGLNERLENLKDKGRFEEIDELIRHVLMDLMSLRLD